MEVQQHAQVVVAVVGKQRQQQAVRAAVEPVQLETITAQMERLIQAVAVVVHAMPVAAVVMVVQVVTELSSSDTP
jgi:hypothetical protein